MEPLLDVRNLEVQFHTLEGVVHAVNGVSFSVEAGTTLGIVGESGCGKSVSVLSVMGLIPQPPGEITSGQILLEGRDLLTLREEEMEKVRGREVAMVFQDPMTSLNPVLTIGRQISEAMGVHLDMEQSQARSRGIELLDMVGIPQAAERYDDYPHQFSGGMRQRVMIAAALACSPSLLIADEPTTALDVTIQAQIIELVKEISAELQMAIVWITHDLAVIAEVAEKVAVMYAGMVVEYADVFEIFQNPSHPYTLALLKSVPRVDQATDQRLFTIPGSPLDCYSLPEGCPFSPRCSFAIERCYQERPPHERRGEDHWVACWVDVKTGNSR